MLKNLFFFSLLLLSSVAFAQTAIRGTVIDDGTGETIPFADVVVQGTTHGTTTDLDGAYHLDVDPGTYALVFNYLGYADLVVENIEVKDGQIEVLDVRMGEDTEQLAEVVVTAKQVRNTEAAVLTLQKKSVSFIDGLSSQTFSKTGDGDAAAAIKRVPGVSVEGGKYVFVRGLGDRYTKTILNGMDIPGLDPDRNTVQMDIFPTNIIDNIIVYKTFTPDLPGDFTGGIVEIVTKDFPEQPTSNVSIGLGYNNQAHFNNDFVTYEGGKTDFLAFDDGSRELPFDKLTVIPDPTRLDQKLNDYTTGMSSQLNVDRKSQFLNRSLSYSAGNQINKEKSTLGYNLAFNYGASSSFDEQAEYAEYRKNQDNSVNQLTNWGTNTGPQSSINTAWSALAGFSIKFDKHKIGISALRSQNGESTAAEFDRENDPENPATIFRDVLQYSQRELTNVLVHGKHSFSEKLELKWKLSPTFSRIYEPDIRQAAYELLENGKYEVRPSVGAVVTRDWRELKEQNYSGKFDITYNFNGIQGLKSKLKGGSSYTYKNRDYEILSYGVFVQNQSAFNFSSNQNDILAPGNVWTPETRQGSYLKGNFEPSNTYDANQGILGLYLMNELPLSSKFKAIYGLRAEQTTNRFTGQNNAGSPVEFEGKSYTRFDNVKVLNEFNLLPSAALIYSIKENMNLRFSYAHTLARPTFKEKSLVQIIDRISNRVFIGNLDLQQTEISNYDIRWEYFMGSGQAVSLSGFYKSFDGPIEMTVFNDLATNNFTPRNVGDATVYGVELELKKTLAFIGLPNFTLNGNVALISSEVDMNEEELESRKFFARDGETIGTTRDMALQSPYLINAGLSYRNIDNGWSGNISFNMQGERLSIVGIGSVPDVYEQPFESLNVKVSKKLDDKIKVGISAQNILNSDREYLYKSFGSQDRLFSRIDPGQTFALSVSYRIK